MSQIFRISGRDRRAEYISAFDSGRDFTTQKPSGRSVEAFTPETGFILLREDATVNYKFSISERVRSVAELSLGPQLELREIYYTIRGNPELIEPFATASNIYKEVLKTIKRMEVLCDLNRSKFTVGNLPKGFIHYGHSNDYGQAERPIGFTENIARSVLSEWEINNAQNIIHMEKAAAATRLVSMGFSKLTNSVISTTGGNFTRAVYALANRFVRKKHMLFFCDGDAYGNDMLRALEYGTEASRHLTPDQAFPERRFAGTHIAGLFPSVAERLDIPNDVEQKRPMSNEHVRKRIEFLKRFDLVDDRDLATWERDKTFELEAMSTKYFSTKPDKDGKYPPVGLGIYLTEYMRLKEIPCKPMPTDDDERLKNGFDRIARDELKREIRGEVERDSPIQFLTSMIYEKITEVIDETIQEIYDYYIDDLEEKLGETTADDIREQAAKQYQDQPRREIFSLREIAELLKDSVEVTVNWNAEELKKRVTETIESYVRELRESGSLYDEYVGLTNLPDVGELRDFYDVVEEEIGADPEDCKEVREALEWRLS